MERECRIYEEKEEKLRRVTEDNAKLRDDLNSSTSERDQLKHDLLNKSQNIEQLQYRLSLTSSP